jgi:RecB family endonuclease NucS
MYVAAKRARRGSSGLVRRRQYGAAAMRLIVARCSVRYTGRLTTELPEGLRLLMIKEDGTFMIWADGGGLKVKPLNSNQ